MEVEKFWAKKKKLFLSPGQFFRRQIGKLNYLQVLIIWFNLASDLLCFRIRGFEKLSSLEWGQKRV